MSNKDLLIDLCEELQVWLSEQAGRIIPVEFISELRPFPAINDPVDEWVVEIKVDGEVIFKDYYAPKKTDDLKIVEGVVLNRIIRSIFFHAMAAQQNSNPPFIQS